jgi:putative ABC transport system permease protein
MIENYIKMAWRNLRSNKVFSFINVFGLSVGLTCCMFIGAYLYQELSYDTYPVDAKQIYRVSLHSIENAGVSDFSAVDAAVGQGIKNAYPQVLAFTRLVRQHPDYIKYGDNTFKEEKLVSADSNFFTVFSIPLLEGDIKTALVQPNSIVITKAFEHKYFGEAPGLNKTLAASNVLYKVTGVIDKIPDNSHFHADAFISMSTLLTPLTILPTYCLIKMPTLKDWKPACRNW